MMSKLLPSLGIPGQHFPESSPTNAVPRGNRYAENTSVPHSNVFGKLAK